MQEAFSRTELLLGEEAMSKLASKRVAVFGIGGVGGHVVEALVRSGIGAVDLIDSDKVAMSNLNRQLIATLDTIGMDKTTAMAKRIAQINPQCKVTTHNCFYLPENRNEFDFTKYDYIVDAVDTVTAKIDLVMHANEVARPIISSMGAGNKLDPTAFEVADIYDTSVCPLAKVMRRELKKRGIGKLKVVYSREEPLKPLETTEETGRRATPGSTAFVPSVVGLIIASEVVKDLALG
ncbi:MAG: tRNA threonylcarbamoyladenosine dehydratase [Lachnospiraceae bacterium]|nr:tRNA threonylcarbamoyladenosine dehydratase [Lachnospiraceae bacterium]MBQ9122269.1 tRNA threonylcarbamoyladenosine dehydratase [Lachnospiraceae bacterium]